jgi:hypothetical protein
LVPSALLWWWVNFLWLAFFCSSFELLFFIAIFRGRIIKGLVQNYIVLKIK